MVEIAGTAALNVPPTQPAGSRIQELGDRLVIPFRPRRAWGELVFLTVWLAFWTLGGIGAMAALFHAGWGAGGFLVVWLCGWFLGECGVSVVIAWKLFGRESLTVTAQHLEVQKEIGPFAPVTRYEVGLVHDVRAALVPTGEDERPRKDFCLEVAYDEKTIRVGEGMGRPEAESIAATVLSESARAGVGAAKTTSTRIGRSKRNSRPQ